MSWPIKWSQSVSNTTKQKIDKVESKDTATLKKIAVRKLNPKWLLDRKWLRYDADNSLMYCEPCQVYVRLGKNPASFVKELTMTDLSKKFVTQGEIDDRRKKRQEEWEKKRAPDDPLECPDEVVDNRSLFERLQEQKEKKEMEFQDSISFKNEIKTLQEDEVQFLNFVSKKEVELTKARNAEEAKIIQEMKESSVARIEPTTSQKEEKKTLTTQIGASQNKKSQQALLAGVVKRKSVDSKDTSKKLKTDESIGSHMAAIQNRNNSSTADDNQTTSTTSQNEAQGQGPSSSSSTNSCGTSESTNNEIPNNKSGKQTAKIIGVLPGLGAYDNDTSDSATSSSDSECDFRLIAPKKIQLHLEHD